MEKLQNVETKSAIVPYIFKKTNKYALAIYVDTREAKYINYTL